MNDKTLTLDKISQYIKRAGRELQCAALAAYETFLDPRTSKKAKLALSAALIYLLAPIDLIADLLPGGLVDDLSVLTTALWAAGQIGREHLKKHRILKGLSSDFKDIA